MTSIVGVTREINLELRQLRYFLRIVDLGSMGKAAVELDIATAALSQQISKLEGELGVTLLHRSSSGAKLTEAGAIFYRSAQLALRRDFSGTIHGAAGQPTHRSRSSVTEFSREPSRERTITYRLCGKNRTHRRGQTARQGRQVGCHRVN